MIIRRAVAARQLLPRDVYFWLKAVLLALVAVQAARLIWILVTPLGPVGRWLPPAPPTIPATAQLALFSTFDPFATAQAPANAAAPAPAVSGFTLFGTRMSFGGAPGSAIIAGADGVQTSYLVGEEVAPGVRLLSVGFDFVLLGGNGAEQRLAMEGAEPPVAAAAAGTVPAGSAALALTPAAIRNNVALAPRLVAGRVSGFLVSATGNPAVLARTGLRDGDIITQVNGRPLTDPAALQSQLSPGARLSLTVERGAATVPVALLLEGNP
ncbi:general secretion pathway protein C [Sphingomonas kaistensis]|uniref:General secretion pathway protein C n=1 Tax=Sphingomonas kaistensis TaxID=298708 RepID=A0A7X5Y7H1_9SPHN|nr:type II secretion system protein N [Sphingomonas kaistensis]NJC06582.1 general secretion pathway protein C [Sphingomonas kaistensis]